MMQQDWKDALSALATPADRPEDTNITENSATDLPQETETARLDVVVERKGRGGKTATIIAGFTVSDEAVEEIASKLKRRLGAGGSARGGEILIQGDRAADVLKALESLGLKSRRI